MCTEIRSETRVKPIYPFIAGLATCLLALIPGLRSFSLTGSSLFFISLLSLYISGLTWIFLKSKTSFSKGITGRIFSVVFLTQLISGLFISSSYFVHKVMFIPHISYSFAEVIISKSAFYRALLTISTVLIFGGGFCGHLCFLGPWEKGTGINSNYKYAFLVLFLLGTTSLIFFSTNFYIAVTATSFFILSLFVIGILSVFTKKRTHCSILCPLASLREITNRISPFKIVTADSEKFICPFGANSGSDHSLCLKCTSCVTSGQSSISIFNLKRNTYEIYVVSIVIVHGLLINLYRF